jgi:hypothetical protein
LPWKVKEVDLMPEKKKDARLSRVGVSGYNKPKRTPKHPTKSHVVVAKEGDKVKTIRFGQQGVSGDKKTTARSKSFKARHAKNIAKGKMSAAYWSNRVKWTIVPIGVTLALLAGDQAYAKLQFEGGNSMPTLQAEKNGAW